MRWLWSGRRCRSNSGRRNSGTWSKAAKELKLPKIFTVWQVSVVQIAQNAISKALQLGPNHLGEFYEPH